MAKSTEMVGFNDKLPAEYEDWGEDAGRGLEHATRNELLTPFLSLLQQMSPQLVEGGDQFVEGARPGMLFNTVTHQTYGGKDGVQIVPVARESIYTEWVSREEGGGFRGIRSITDPEVLRLRKEQGGFRKLTTPDNTELIEQFNLFILYGPAGQQIDATNAMEAVLAFTSTKINVYKNFFSVAKAIRYPTARGPVEPPLWAHRWNLTTVTQKNNKGTFYNYKLALVDPTPTVTMPVASMVKPSDPLYQRAKAFADMLREGAVAADYASSDQGGSSDMDDNIPF